MNWVGGAKTIDAAQQILGQGGVPNIQIVDGNGKPVALRMEHAWVEALIQNQPARGAKHIQALHAKAAAQGGKFGLEGLQGSGHKASLSVFCRFLGGVTGSYA